VSLELFLKRENYFKPTSVKDMYNYGSFVTCNKSDYDSLQLNFSYDFKKIFSFDPKSNSIITYPTNSFIIVYKQGKIISATSSLHPNGNKLNLKLDKLFVSDLESNFLQRLKNTAMKNSLLLKTNSSSQKIIKSNIKII
jgi:hypothetical protein